MGKTIGRSALRGGRSSGVSLKFKKSINIEGVELTFSESRLLLGGYSEKFPVDITSMWLSGYKIVNKLYEKGVLDNTSGRDLLEGVKLTRKGRMILKTLEKMGGLAAYR